MKKYERTIVSIIIVLVFIIGAFVYFKHLPKTASIQPESLPNMAAAIIKNGNAAECSQLAGKMDQGVDYETVCKNNIAQNTAMSNLDIKSCDGLDDKLMSIAGCQQSVIAGLINKEGNISVCDQFTDTLKASCVNEYWSMTANKKQDPSLCKNITPSSPQVITNCQYNILLSSTMGTSTSPNCSLFTGTLKTDCTNLTKHNCQAISFPPLQEICQRGIR